MNRTLTQKTDQIIKIICNKIQSHKFLNNFSTISKDEVKLRKFAIQWYKAVESHKYALPLLLWNIKHDELRIEILKNIQDEYGNGNPKNIHAKILMNFLNSLGITENQIRNTTIEKGVAVFSKGVEHIWKEKSSAEAYGLHVALEAIASILHKKFADELEISQNNKDILYFKLHREAEPEHYQNSLKAITKFNGEENEIMKGIQEGKELVNSLLNGLITSVG